MDVGALAAPSPGASPPATNRVCTLTDCSLHPLCNHKLGWHLNLGSSCGPHISGGFALVAYHGGIHRAAQEGKDFTSATA